MTKSKSTMMDKLNHRLVSLSLQETHAEVKRRFPEINLKSARYWTYKLGRDQWEFHGPNSFYWHGRAFSGWEARQKGWEAWLRTKDQPKKEEVSCSPLPPQPPGR